MRNSIALIFAQAGIEVALVDVDALRLDRALTVIRCSLETLSEHGTVAADAVPGILERIHPSTHLATAVDGVDFVEDAGV